MRERRRERKIKREREAEIKIIMSFKMIIRDVIRAMKSSPHAAITN